LAVERALVAASPVPVRDLVKEVDLALRFAARKGNAAFMRYMIDLGARVDGELLAFASLSESEELVDVLLRAGARTTANSFVVALGRLDHMPMWRTERLYFVPGPPFLALRSELPALRRVLATMPATHRSLSTLLFGIMDVARYVVEPVSALEALCAVYGSPMTEELRVEIFATAAETRAWPAVEWAMDHLGPPPSSAAADILRRCASFEFRPFDEDDPGVNAWRRIARSGTPAAIARIRHESASQCLLAYGLLRDIYHPSMGVPADDRTRLLRPTMMAPIGKARARTARKDHSAPQLASDTREEVGGSVLEGGVEGRGPSATTAGLPPPPLPGPPEISLAGGMSATAQEAMD
jgi:hypothetical protein